MTLDVLDLARDLIRRPSVTPADEGAMDVLQRALEGKPGITHAETHGAG